MAKKKKPMGIGSKILLMICLIVFCGSGFYLGSYFYKAWKAQDEFSQLTQIDMDLNDIRTDKGTIIGKYAGMWKENSDIIGWVKMEDTKIDYPVMQTKEDPEFYLHRSFKKEYSDSGTPFMDADSDIFIPTSNWLIYGHHMKSGIMFHDIVKYEQQDFYQKHPTFKFDTIYKGGQGTYQIIAAGYSKIYNEDENVFKYYQYADIDSKERFDEYVAGVKSISVYETGETAEYGDQLVTLSTCTYQTEDGRFFVVGKRIDAKQKKPEF